MSINELRQNIREFIKFKVPEFTTNFVIHESVMEDGYHRLRISYISEEGDEIPAYLLHPEMERYIRAVLSPPPARTDKDILERAKSAAWWAIRCRHLALNWPNLGLLY